MLLLDSGDTLLGKPQAKGGALPIAAMNAMGYQAMAVGAADLDAPLSTLSARFGEAQFALLSANLQQGPTPTLPLKPYLLVPFQGYTVAVIGVTAPKAAAKAATVGLPLQVEEATAAVQRAVGEVRGQAQVIIVLSNLTLAENVALAKTVPGLDAVIGAQDAGGGQRPSEVSGPAGRVILHAAGRQGQYLGVLTLHLDRQGQVVFYQGNAILLTADFADDPVIVQLLKQYGVQPNY